MDKEIKKSIRNYTIEDLEGILDKLPYQVWLKDKDGKHIYINKLGAESIGLPKEDIIGKTDYDIRDYSMAKNCVKTDMILRDKKRDVYNEEHSRKDGQDIWYKVHKFILNRDNIDKEIIGGIAEEISLEKSVQLKLENNLVSYLNKSNIEDDRKKILNSILISLKEVINFKNIDILLYDENKKKFNLYLSENIEVSKFKNCSEIYINEEIEKKLCCKNIYENRYSELYDKIVKLQNNSIEDNLKIKHIELANKLFGLICISYSKDRDKVFEDDSYLNEILIKICIIIKQIENKGEITSIKKKKDELEANIELEAIKTEFFANVSHEFRTPVNIILSIVQLLNSYIKNNNMNLDNEKYKEYLNILRQNSYRLLRLVNNTIDTAKVNNNFYDLKLGNYNIISIVENITMSTVRYANEKKRNIVFDTNQEELILACDPDKIEKIILNLISNAIKFSECDTDIEIKINTDLASKRVFISVKDYGEIIEEYDRERIFGKFTQTENLFIRKNEGSGIGLFLVKKFVEMHNGKIYVENIENATQFTFYLPIYIIGGKEVHNTIIDENDILNKCNIEFSDI
ncbi:ATP-binding protein [Clostridium nigeriense]|uniref:sensor histidine kinase n=1 Tax=Clostridium nigeriense TaxID=1805470 RepID=UPI003D351DF3